MEAVRNHYWPCQTIIDENGEVAYEHLGEGGYREIEAKVVELLKEAKAGVWISVPGSTTIGTSAEVA